MSRFRSLALAHDLALAAAGQDLLAAYQVAPALLALELHGLGCIDTATSAEAICALDDGTINPALAVLDLVDVREGVAGIAEVGAQVGQGAGQADAAGEVEGAGGHEDTVSTSGSPVCGNAREASRRGFPQGGV